MSGELMAGEDLMARSGARWCSQHSRWECAAAVKREHHATAVRGMAYCKNHSGRSLALTKAIGEANLMAWSTAAAPADALLLDPGRVVMDQLRVAVLRADVYGELLRFQLETQGETGLVAPTYAAGREGQRLETGEQVRGLAKQEAEWRDRAVRFAKTAHDMGIDERQIELEERQAAEVVAAAGAGLEALGLSPDQREVFLRGFLSYLATGDAEMVAGELAPGPEVEA